MKRQVWIDLTDLSRWTAHMTGIQRVVYNVAFHFHEKGTARFFAYNRDQGFHEVDFALISEVLRGPHLKAAAAKQPGFPLRQIHLALSFPSRASGALYRRTSFAFQERFRGTRAQILRQVQDARLQRSGVQPAPPVAHPFSDGDVLLLLGASWSDNHILALSVIKRTVRLSIVHAIMDLIPVKLPQFFVFGIGRDFMTHMFDVFSVSDHLLAISENTRLDAIEFQQRMNLPAVPISVFRLGDNSASTPAEVGPDPSIVPGEYVLAVGTLEVRKNYLALYNAWVIAAESGKPFPKLVIVGQTGWLADDFMYQAQADPRVADSIVILRSVGDEELAWLYANCLLTAYPSWYEGWGLPVGESLHFGKLCIASSASSVPEIAGDLIDYCAPYDVRGFYETIRRYVDDPAALAEREARIAREYVPTSWERSYDDCVVALEALEAGTGASE